MVPVAPLSPGTKNTGPQGTRGRGRQPWLRDPALARACQSPLPRPRVRDPLGSSPDPTPSLLWVHQPEGFSVPSHPPSLHTRDCVRMPVLSWGPGAPGAHVCGRHRPSPPQSRHQEPRGSDAHGHSVSRVSWCLPGTPSFHTRRREWAPGGREILHSLGTVTAAPARLKPAAADAKSHRTLSGHRVSRTIWGCHRTPTLSPVASEGRGADPVFPKSPFLVSSGKRPLEAAPAQRRTHILGARGQALGDPGRTLWGENRVLVAQNPRPLKKAVPPP